MHKPYKVLSLFVNNGLYVSLASEYFCGKGGLVLALRMAKRISGISDPEDGL